MERNVVVAVFKVESEGYQALTELKQEAGTDTYLVSAAALIKKVNGACAYLDGFDTGVHTSDDTAVGGLIGMTVGVLGGPIGMLLGAGIGSMVGANVDAGDALFGTAMLEQIADKLEDGTVAIIALEVEDTPDELDKKLSAYDTVIARFDADAVADEVDRAAEMANEMARQARLELRKERKEKVRQKIEEKKEEAQKISEENIDLIKKEFDK